jgi:membrane protein required for colicin V production
MNWADYLIIVLLSFSCIVGFMRGLLREMISLITWVLAAALAWRLAGTLEPYLGSALGSAAVRTWVARAVVFVAVLLAGTAVGAILSHFVRLSIFSGLDRMLGALFGALRGVVLLGLAAMLCQTARISAEGWYRQSLLLPYAGRAADMLRVVTGAVDSTSARLVLVHEWREG